VWENGKKNGFGVYQYYDGTVYDGEFVDDEMEGGGEI